MPERMKGGKQCQINVCFYVIEYYGRLNSLFSLIRHQIVIVPSVIHCSHLKVETDVAVATVF